MAAGLGFKTFTTGEVLTAADTNGYLMQGILVFATEAARNAAITSPQEGQFAFTKDTNSTWFYDGAAWVVSGATGDVTGVTAGTGITVTDPTGPVPTVSFDQANFGGGQFAAGKNKIINGDFTFNQRNFTSNTSNNAYNFDRWVQQNSGGSFTVTPQSFTPGAAPVAGYEGTTFIQGVTATQSAASDYAIFTQRIENVRNYAGTTVTISFYAKANTGTPKIGVELQQNFGTTGSPSATVSIPAGSITLTTSFARYSVTVAVPSISGKTIGTTANSSFLELNLWTSAGATYAARASSIGVQNFTASIWGVQVEAGSTATPFQIASGSIGGELALCQRYYYRLTADATNPAPIYGFGTGTAATSGRFGINLLATMRVPPSSVDFNSLGMSDGVNATTAITALVLLTNGIATNNCGVNATTASGITTYRPYFIVGNGASGAYLGLTAEYL